MRINKGGLVSAVLVMIGAAACTDAQLDTGGEWQVDFFDDFDEFNSENWQDQLLWVNDEDQCYVRDGQYNTREVSDGTLKLRVVSLDEELSCAILNKHGEQHPDTRYVAGRIASKNRKEFVKGRWTCLLYTADAAEE